MDTNTFYLPLTYEQRIIVMNGLTDSKEQWLSLAKGSTGVTAVLCQARAGHSEAACDYIERCADQHYRILWKEASAEELDTKIAGVEEYLTWLKQCKANLENQA